MLSLVWEGVIKHLLGEGGGIVGGFAADIDEHWLPLMYKESKTKVEQADHNEGDEDNDDR